MTTRTSPCFAAVKYIVNSVVESGVILKLSSGSFELDKVRATAFKIPILVHYLDLNSQHISYGVCVLLFGLTLFGVTFTYQADTSILLGLNKNAWKY